MTTKWRSVGQKQYFKLDSCEKGQVLVEEAKYLGSKENRMYPGTVNFEFRELSGGPDKVLSGGHLKWLLEQNAKEGDICRVTYLGKDKLPETSKFAGRLSHQFDLQIAEDEGQLNVSQIMEVQENPQAKNSVDLSDLD
jgi:hypothetical protein